MLYVLHCHTHLVHWLDFLYPPICQGCGRWGAWMCRRCWSHCNWITKKGFVLPSAYPSLYRVWSAMQYDEVSEKFIQGLKYSRHRMLAQPLGDMFARQFEDVLRRWQVEAIIPVPLHPKRYNSRGFNQAALLAERIHARTHIHIDKNLLVRSTWMVTQAKQNRVGRQSLHYMFRCTQRPSYGTVCLIDDVCTTGATLSACARALNQAGVKRIIAITVARA